MRSQRRRIVSVERADVTLGLDAPASLFHLSSDEGIQIRGVGWGPYLDVELRFAFVFGVVEVGPITGDAIADEQTHDRLQGRSPTIERTRRVIPTRLRMPVM